MRVLVVLVALLQHFVLSAQFEAGRTIHAIPFGPALEARDMDGDGDLDLISVSDGNLILTWRNSDGAGNFSPVDTVLVLPSPAVHFVLEDLNGDGATDLLFIASEGELLEVAWNNGSGLLLPPVPISALDHTPGALRVGDLSGNGWPDAVITFSEDDAVGIAFWPNLAGVFSQAVLVPALLQGEAPTVMAIGDLDGTGGQDIFVIGSDLAAVGLMNGASNGSAWDILPLFFNFDYPLVRPQLMDVDGDGDMDIAEANGLAVQWVENRLDTSDGNFRINVVAPFTSAGNGQFANLGCSTSAGVVFVPSNPGLPVRWSSHIAAIEGFAPRKALQDVQRGLHPRLADLNGDGRPDMILVRAGGAEWHPNALAPATTEVQVPLFDSLCIQGPSIVLPEALPEGGEWTGRWIQNGELFRSNASVTGDEPLDYTFYEEAGCPVGDRAFIHLVTGPTVSPSVGPILCSAERPIHLTARPSTVEWVGLTTDGILDPATFNGSIIVCAFTDPTSTSCITFVGPISLWPSVSSEIQEAGPFCITSGVQTILPVVDLPGTTWSGDIVSSTNGSALFDPSQGAGEYRVVLDRVPTIPQQCANSDTLVIIVVDDLPEVSVSQLPVFCAEGPLVTLEGGSPEGGTWSGPGVIDGALDPALVGEGSHPTFYNYTNAAGCTASAVLFVELAAQAVVETSERAFCQEDDAVQFMAWPEGGTWTAPLDGSGLFAPAEVPPGIYELMYTYTAPNGCVLSNPRDSLQVLEATAVQINALPIYCVDGGTVVLQGSASGTWSGAVAGSGSSVSFDPSDLGSGIWTVTLTVDPADGCLGESSVQFSVESCVGYAEHLSAGTVRVAPNPFAESTVLLMELQGGLIVDVLDATGRLIMSRTLSGQGPTALTLDLGGQADGTYVLRVRSNGATQYHRIVKSS
ncbi:MAG: T9SS type A sorting domain-containing protein [Flavobacteriales bacterium]